MFFLNIHNFNNVSVHKLHPANTNSVSGSVKWCEFTLLIGLQVTMLPQVRNSAAIVFNTRDMIGLQNWHYH
jgi:hypothetical protein